MVGCGLMEEFELGAIRKFEVVVDSPLGRSLEGLPPQGHLWRRNPSVDKITGG